MKLNEFLKTWDGVRAENRVWRLVGVILAVAIVVLAIEVRSIDRAVVLIPPTLNKKVEVTRKTATLDYRKSWALYLASLAGNINPGNSSMVKEAIEPLLAPAIHRKLMDAIEEQINAIKLDRVTLTYSPRRVMYESETDKIFVTGLQTSTGPSAKPKTVSRTYEFLLDIDDYRVVIEHAKAYPGPPKFKKPDDV